MELAAAILLGAVDFVEAPTPVDTQQTKHRQEDTDADTRRTLEVERVVVADIREAVTGLEEAVRCSRLIK